MCKRKTHKEFLKEFNELSAGEYTLLSEYKDAKKKIDVKCSKCGGVFDITPSNYLSGKRCPYCTGKRVLIGFNDIATLYPHLAEEFYTEKNNGKTPYDFTIGSSKRVWWKCSKNEKHVWEVAINERTINNMGCPYCANKKVLEGDNDLKTTHPHIAKEWNYNKNKGLLPTTLTYGSDKEVWWECQKCNHEWKARVYTRTKGHGCPCCAGIVLNQGVNDLETKYPLLVKEWDYTKNLMKPSEICYGSDKRVWWICSDCGSNWETRVSLRTSSKRGCPKCNKSKGENEVADYLENMSIKFERQYRTHKCKNRYVLPFDFAIFNKNNELICLIECDGEQHFYPISFFGGEEGFNRTKKNDEIKNNYCKDNNVPLIRIPYWLRGYADSVLDHFLTPLLKED